MHSAPGWPGNSRLELCEVAVTLCDELAAALYQKMFAALSRLMEARGIDLTWRRSLYRRLRAHGLANVGIEGYVVVWEGRSPGARLTGYSFWLGQRSPSWGMAVTGSNPGHTPFCSR